MADPPAMVDVDFFVSITKSCIKIACKLQVDLFIRHDNSVVSSNNSMQTMTDPPAMVKVHFTSLVFITK